VKKARAGGEAGLHICGSKGLDSKQAARIHELATSVAGARVKAADSLASDEMETKVDIRRDDGSSSLHLHTGDSAPPEVWDLIGEVSRASDNG
jgi:hypothetical protein